MRTCPHTGKKLDDLGFLLKSKHFELIWKEAFYGPRYSVVQGKPTHCEGSEGPCDAADIALTPSRTAYGWDGYGPDPNRGLWLCRKCAESHHAYWDDMWGDYWTIVM